MQTNERNATERRNRRMIKVTCFNLRHSGFVTFQMYDHSISIDIRPYSLTVFTSCIYNFDYSREISLAENVANTNTCSYVDIFFRLIGEQR